MHLFRLQGKMPCINWPLTVRRRKRFHTLKLQAAEIKSPFSRCITSLRVHLFTISLLHFLWTSVIQIRLFDHQCCITGTYWGFTPEFVLAGLKNKKEGSFCSEFKVAAVGFTLWVYIKDALPAVYLFFTARQSFLSDPDDSTATWDEFQKSWRPIDIRVKTIW